MIEKIADEMKTISVEFYGNKNPMIDEKLLNNHIVSLKSLRKKTGKCKDSDRKDEIFGILDKAVKGLTKHFDKIKGM